MTRSWRSRMKSGRVNLQPDEKMVRQMIGLERRTGRSGRDTIDHSPGAYDDLADAAAGVVAVIAGKARSRFKSSELMF